MQNSDIQRYTMFSVKASGSTNDVTAWDISENNYLVTQEKMLPPAFFFIGDMRGLSVASVLQTTFTTFN